MTASLDIGLAAGAVPQAGGALPGSAQVAETAANWRAPGATAFMESETAAESFRDRWQALLAGSGTGDEAAAMAMEGDAGGSNAESPEAEAAGAIPQQAREQAVVEKSAAAICLSRRNRVEGPSAQHPAVVAETTGEASPPGSGKPTARLTSTHGSVRSGEPKPRVRSGPRVTSQAEPAIAIPVPTPAPAPAAQQPGPGMGLFRVRLAQAGLPAQDAALQTAAVPQQFAATEIAGASAAEPSGQAPEVVGEPARSGSESSATARLFTARAPGTMEDAHPVLPDTPPGVGAPSVASPAPVEDRRGSEASMPTAWESQLAGLLRRGAAPTGSHSAKAEAAPMGATGVHGAASPAGSLDAAGLAHIPVTGQGGEHSLHVSSAASAAPVAPREMFTALDGEASAAGPRWIHAGAQHAEAGFQDPALGWVGIRADLGAGGVHATVLPGSADAAQVLGGHMANLHAHLAAQEIPVQSLSMSGAAEGQGAALGQGALQQGAEHSGRGSEQGSGVPPSMLRGEAGQHLSSEQHSAGSPAESAPAAHGTYISVVA